MQKLATVALLFAMLCYATGCAQLLPTGISPPSPPSASPLTRAVTEGCEVLGQVTANAECACYDRMSYKRLQGQATSKALNMARRRYPDSDVVRISSVDVYLNSAVAHGIAYRCIGLERG